MFDEKTLLALVKLILGESDLTPYQTGSKLVSWFNQHGFNDEYGAGFPSRKDYVIQNLKILNGSSEIGAFLESIPDPRRLLVDDGDYSSKKIATKVNDIIAYDNKMLVLEKKRYKIISIDEDGQIDITVKFDEIQKMIIEQINSAEILVWIAVAWFTDPKIYDVLIKKEKEGIDIQIITSDDEINDNASFDLDESFYTTKVPPSGKYKNIFHNKFCIIDLKKVIHGSYNWTKKASFNHESAILVENRETAEKFAKNFLKIRSL